MNLCRATCPGMDRDLCFDHWCDLEAGHQGAHFYGGGAQGTDRPNGSEPYDWRPDDRSS